MTKIGDAPSGGLSSGMVGLVELPSALSGPEGELLEKNPAFLLATAVYDKLLQAKLVRAPALSPEKARAAYDNGEVKSPLFLIASEVADVDGDGRYDVTLSRLLTLDFLRPGVSYADVRAALASEPHDQIVNGSAAGVADGTAQGPALVQGLTPPQTVARLQQSVIRPNAVATDVPVAKVRQDGSILISLPVELRLADGRVVPFTDAVPTGAKVVGGEHLEVFGAQISLGFLDARGERFVTDLSGALKPVNPNADPEAARAALVRLLTLLPESQLQSTPESLAFAEHVRKQIALLAATTPPADPSLQVVWRAAHVTTPELEAKRRALADKYGVLPLRWLGFVDDVREVGAVQAFQKAAQPKLGVPVDWLYVIAVGEGLNGLLSADGTSFVPPTYDDRVSGFSELGVDTFGTRVEGLKKRGLLRQNFAEGVDYLTMPDTNEKDEPVVSASFPDLARGLEALASMIAAERQQFLVDARRVLGADRAEHLTDEQLFFFTYVYFNAGPLGGRRLLERRGLNAAEAWRGKLPDHNRNAQYNAMQRLQTLRLLRAFAIF